MGRDPIGETRNPRAGRIREDEMDLIHLEEQLSEVLVEIRNVREIEAPPDLAGHVLRAIEPKRPSAWRRLLLWADSPQTVTVTPWKLIPAALAVLVILFTPFLSTTRGVREYTAGKPTVRAPVVFTYRNNQASTVQVIGTFNEWDPKGFEMRFDPHTQQWSLELALPPGRHEYSFLVNGQQSIPDPQAVITNDDGFGNKNSVVFISNDLSI